MDTSNWIVEVMDMPMPFSDYVKWCAEMVKKYGNRKIEFMLMSPDNKKAIVILGEQLDL